MTGSGMLMGSAAYLSPEQARAEPVTPSTDVYALGILVYELLTGRHPFPDLDPVQLIQRHLTQPLPALSDSLPGLPATLDPLLQKATAKFPAHRYPSVAALWDDLRQALSETQQPIAPDQPISIPAFLQEEAEQTTVAFVGRERELATLEVQLAAVLEGHGRVVFVAGGAGQGKTALALAFAQRASSARPDLLVLTGGCNAQAGIGDPYLPFRETVDMLTGGVEVKLASGAISRQGARRLWAALPDTIQTLLETAPDLIDRLIPGSLLAGRAASAAAQSAEWRIGLEAFLHRKAVLQAASAPTQIDLFEQFTRLLRTVSERNPLLMILDDFQWADDASISLFFHLGRRIADRRILILCAYRPDEVALGRDGERHPLEQVIHELVRVHGLQPLDLTESVAAEGWDFIEAFLETEPNRLGLEFRRALHQHTGGHPLFTIELLRAMQQRGDLRQDPDGYWVESPELAWDQLPARVEAVIEERIARLTAELRELLAVASVEGQDFTAQVLARVQAVEERKLLRELSQELEKRHRLVREVGELVVGRQVLSRFQFAHQLFQRYLYNGLSAGERRLLHGEIAAVLEELFADDLSHGAVQLAYHYGRAALPEKAAPYLKQAGDQARASYANQEAIRYYSEWLELWPSPSPERFDVLAARSEVYGLVGRPQDQRADAEAMLRLAQDLRDQTRHCDALLALADHYLETEHILAREPAEQAFQIAESLSDSVREGHALRRLGWEEWQRLEVATSRVHLEAAVARFRQAGLPAEAAVCLHVLSLALGNLMDRPAAMRAAQDAVTLSREAGDRRQEAIGLRRLAIRHFYQGEFETALPIAEEALALHSAVGDWSQEAHALNVLGIIHAWLGRFGESETNFRRSLEMGLALGATIAVENAAWNLLGNHYWRRGEYQAALEFGESQLERALEAEDEFLVASFHYLKGRVLSEFGRHQAALAALTTAHSIATKLGSIPTYAATTLARMAWEHLELGNSVEAGMLTEQAGELAQKSGIPVASVWPSVLEARIALVTMEPEQMRQTLGKLEPVIELSSEVWEGDSALEAYNIAARLYLALGDREKALQMSAAMIELLDRVPHHLGPQDYLLTHFRVLQALGRETEAGLYMRRAYEHVQWVANTTTDSGLRESWLRHGRGNPEILAEGAERGMA